MNRILNLSNADIKTLDKDTVSRTLENLGQMLGKGSRGFEHYQEIETAELDLALKFIKCPFLERRLKGIMAIKEMIKRSRAVPRSIYSGAQTQTTQNQTKPLKCLKEQNISQWILDNNLVLLLMKDYAHIEVTKRAAEILKCLSRNQMLTQDILDLIWELSRTAHESEVVELYSLIVELSVDLSIEQRSYIFQLMTQIPPQ